MLSRIKLNNFNITFGQISSKQPSISLFILSIPTAFRGLSDSDAFVSSSKVILSSSGPLSWQFGGKSIGLVVLRRVLKWFVRAL